MAYLEKLSFVSTTLATYRVNMNSKYMLSNLGVSAEMCVSLASSATVS